MIHPSLGDGDDWDWEYSFKHWKELGVVLWIEVWSW